MLLIPNKYVVIPEHEELIVLAKELAQTIPRQADQTTQILVNQSEIILPFTPVCPDWVEVYIAGNRVLNPPLSLKIGGTIYQNYNLDGNRLTFNVPVAGEITVICDKVPNVSPLATIIPVKNIQQKRALSVVSNAGEHSVDVTYKQNDVVTYNFRNYFSITDNNLGNIPDAGLEAWNPIVPGLYCEPVVLVQPKFGYARLTADRQSIAYVPNRLYRGTDSFTYTLITQSGQPGPARCAFVVVMAA